MTMRHLIFLKRYSDYRIELSEYIESVKYFNELCECCSDNFNKKLDKMNETWIERVYSIIGTNEFAKSTNSYKKGKLFEILLILYVTEGHKEIDSSLILLKNGLEMEFLS